MASQLFMYIFKDSIEAYRGEISTLSKCFPLKYVYNSYIYLCSTFYVTETNLPSTYISLPSLDDYATMLLRMYQLDKVAQFQ